MSWLDDTHEHFDGPDFGEPHETECKRCGQGRLTWEDDDGRWVLLDARGKVHVCDAKRLHRSIADDFDDLDAETPARP